MAGTFRPDHRPDVAVCARLRLCVTSGSRLSLGLRVGSASAGASPDISVVPRVVTRRVTCTEQSRY